MDMSLLYVSHSRIGAPDTHGQLDAIVAVSLARNAALKVTGALVSTPRAFAQILEGPGEAIDELMDSINRDPRHTGVSVLIHEPIRGRRFSRWSLAYAGQAGHMGGFVEPLLIQPGDPPPAPEGVRRLQRVMTAFAWGG
jgi:hypothetical protein